MKTVVATSMGFYNGARVRSGTTFEVPDNFKATWVAAVGSPAAAPSKPKPRQELRTLSEMSKAPVRSATDIV